MVIGASPMPGEDAPPVTLMVFFTKNHKKVAHFPALRGIYPGRNYRKEVQRMETRFRKVSQTGGTYVTALFVDPETWETKSVCVRDYDYDDCSRDNDELYYMEIDREAEELYRKHLNIVAVGDTVEVVKGRKIPHGTIAKVAKVYDWKDCYGRVQTRYAVFEDGRKTSVYNCKII